eukprot:TRINITY_DN12748_c0_g1_i1.p1 TRINITY_DN12748_c0_g1~~TRINITY_DN12748_c0_g1_i1.p1  ORF type:complete len:148 (-),score=11.95 TRINITY_DN12748_c0_g1_i1:77-520(-)
MSIYRNNENKETMKEKSSKIMEVYDKQINLPRNLLLKIICLLEYSDISSFLQCCKQIYFISKTAQFWRDLIDNKTLYNKEELKDICKIECWRQIFLEYTSGWDICSSDHDHLSFHGKLVRHVDTFHVARAYTKKKIHEWAREHDVHF